MAKGGSKAIDGTTEQQRLFCYEYMNNLGNGEAAAIKAGYSAKTAAATASRLLTYVNVQSLLKELKQIGQDKAIVTKEQIITELAKIGFSDIRQLFDADNRLIDIKSIPDEIAASLSTVEIDELLGHRETVFTKREQIGWTKKVKLWDKLKALAQIADLYGYNAPAKVAQTNTAGEDAKTELSDNQFDKLLTALNASNNTG